MESSGSMDFILIAFFAFIGLMVAVFIGGFIALVVWGLKKREKRINDLKQTAAKIGWNYRERAELSEIPRHLLDPSLVHNGVFVSNYLSGNIHGLSAIAFDYTYRIGFSSNSNASVFTVFALSAPHLNLPAFGLCEENFFNKLSIQISGKNDLNFPAFPNFSARYLLDAADENAVRQTFNQKVVAFYETNPTFQTITDGKFLLIAPNKGVVEPSQYQNWIQMLWTLHETFSNVKNI